MAENITETSVLALRNKETGQLVTFDELVTAVTHVWWGGPTRVGEWWEDEGGDFFEEFYDLREVVELTREEVPSGHLSGSTTTVGVLTIVKTQERVLLGDLRVLGCDHRLPKKAIRAALGHADGSEWERELPRGVVRELTSHCPA